MIEATNIGKKFRNKYIFRNFTFSIKEGQMVAFTGESGSGKTTLLNCIGQLEDLSEGKILIKNQVVTSRNKKILFRDVFGFLFQNFALIDNETIEDNLKLVSKDTRRMQELLEQFGVSSSLKTKIYKLSGGEQQRIALIRLILKNPEIIIADEPTASLDKKNGTLVMETLQDLNKQGKTVLVVTHDQSLLPYFDRVIDLHEINNKSTS